MRLQRNGVLIFANPRLRVHVLGVNGLIEVGWIVGR